MKLDACKRLQVAPLSGVWFRTLELRYLETSLRTRHTKLRASRFSPGSKSNLPFEILYLCENTLVAHFEVGALLGLPWEAGEVLSRPGKTWIDLNVTVRLQRVADLTQVREQRRLRTTVQELTGDWQGYNLRRPGLPVPEPGGLAPTQELGEALHRVPGLEGFLSVSAKVPHHRNLIVFPRKLRKGSLVRFEAAERGICLTIRPRRRRPPPRAGRPGE